MTNQSEMQVQAPCVTRLSDNGNITPDSRLIVGALEQFLQLGDRHSGVGQDAA